MPRKRYLVRQVGSVLRLHRSDGWTEDLVQSILSTGDVCFHVDFWHLSFMKVSAFDEERLSDLCSDIILGGRALDDLQRANAIKYYSSTGVFEYGQRTPRKYE